MTHLNYSNSTSSCQECENKCIIHASIPRLIGGGFDNLIALKIILPANLLEYSP